MAIEIQPYSSDREAAVREFNQRLKARGCSFRFPEKSAPTWLPRVGDDPTYEEFFLANDAGTVRGAYVLKRQQFWIDGASHEVGSVYFPLSEGVVDVTYSRVALQLVMDALKKQPLLYSLGMGGVHLPYPMLLKAAGWTLHRIPFLFTVLQPTAFLKHFAIARRRRALRILLDGLGATGLGWLSIKALNMTVGRPSAARADSSAELVPEFGDWADRLWQAGRNNYALAAIRDSCSLNRIYPPESPKTLRLRISMDGKPIGWTVCLDTKMSDHKQFGAMRVGSIIDCFSLPDRESAVALATAKVLKARGADIVVSNQSHVNWQRAFSRAGFLRGPTNFILAVSPNLAQRLVPFKLTSQRVHLTRGDGEGPGHL